MVGENRSQRGFRELGRNCSSKKPRATYRSRGVFALGERSFQVTQSLQLSAFLLSTWHRLLQLLLLSFQIQHANVTAGTQHLMDRKAAFPALFVMRSSCPSTAMNDCLQQGSLQFSPSKTQGTRMKLCGKWGELEG